jgi:hypothetical protein
LVYHSIDGIHVIRSGMHHCPEQQLVIHLSVNLVLAPNRSTKTEVQMAHKVKGDREGEGEGEGDRLPDVMAHGHTCDEADA